MPELLEVETICRGLASRLADLKIKRVMMLEAKSWQLEDYSDHRKQCRDWHYPSFQAFDAESGF